MTTYTLTIDQQTFDVEVGAIQGNLAQVTVNQTPYTVHIDSQGQVVPETITRAEVQPPTAGTAPSPVKPSPGPAQRKDHQVTAPLPGKVLSLMVKAGDKVLAGQVVAVIEAMKMENEIASPVDGTVKEVRVSRDADLATGDLIMVIG